MAAAAEAHADLLVLTSDNPRSESPSAILAQLRAGLRRVPHQVEEDRARAIDAALQAADPADVVLIAGKGHETYQEIGRERIAFSDVEKAREALRSRAAKTRADAGSLVQPRGSEGV
jgi:UDP-N-acetylmuramoyl-L-alanyl-D-glutamate--2,6-diaminopimelate ligase